MPLPALVVGATLVLLGLSGCVDLGDSTDCYADFPTKRSATNALAQAHARGIDDVDLFENPHSVSLRLSSGETGADAQNFRNTVRDLAISGGGRLEKNTPCIERPPFT
jgi:hypothetical protein